MLYPAGRYNLNFDICSVLLCLFVLAFFVVRKNLHARRMLTFVCLIVFMLLCSSAELTMDIFRNGTVSYRVWEAETATFISHVTHNSIPYLLAFYFMSLTGIMHGITKRQIAILSAPEALLVIFHIIPVLRRQLYYFTADAEYVRGPLYGFYMVIVAIYVVMIFAILWSHRSAIRRKDHAYILIIGIGFLISMVIGELNEYLRATNFLQTLLLVGGFFGLENDDAMIDPVSGLYNGNALIRDTGPLFESGYKSQALAIKMQHFNFYRLMLGVDTVRKVAVEIGEWLKEQSSANVLFYRISYGEFAVIMFNHSDEDAHELAERLRVRFAQPWFYSDDNVEVSIPSQIWVSSIPDMISTEEQLLVFAESSFDDRLPRNRIYVADEMKEEQRHIEVDMAVRRALRDETFEVHFQPIYNTVTGKISSCEALVRLKDPELGWIPPDEFIKVAEQTGTVSQIGTVVFEKVCRFISEMKPFQYGLKFVEVNLSVIQCMDEKLVDRFQSIMDRYGVKAEQIVLEVTESAVIYNEDRINCIINKLHSAGFAFALDDFGTGNSNYSYVLNYPFSIIKIDKSFLWLSEKSENDRLVLNNMLDLVRDLKLQAVVEGVETEKQKEWLERAGVRYLQGYYYSRPVPEEDFMKYIRQFNSRLQGGRE